MSVGRGNNHHFAVQANTFKQNQRVLLLDLYNNRLV